MNTRVTLHADRGMTLFEVLVVVAVVLVLAAILLPALSRPRRHSRVGCENDLKQVGLAFKVWEGDNNDKFPMQVPVTTGGTMELVGSGVVWRHFSVMSNELNTPKILLCPLDSERGRSRADVFTDGTPSFTPGVVGFTGDSNTSYFIGVDASDLMPAMPLSGDRNLTVNNFALEAGLHALPTNAPTGWSDAMHRRNGNVLFADGSVQPSSSAQLPGYFHASGVATNRLAVP